MMSSIYDKKVIRHITYYISYNIYDVRYTIQYISCQVIWCQVCMKSNTSYYILHIIQYGRLTMKKRMLGLVNFILIQFEIYKYVHTSTPHVFYIGCTFFILIQFEMCSQAAYFPWQNVFSLTVILAPIRILRITY